MDGVSYYKYIKRTGSFQFLALSFPSCVPGGSVKLRESSAHTAAFHDGRDVCVHVSLPRHGHRRFSQGKPCTRAAGRKLLG